MTAFRFLFPGFEGVRGRSPRGSKHREAPASILASRVFDFISSQRLFALSAPRSTVARWNCYARCSSLGRVT